MTPQNYERVENLINLLINKRIDNKNYEERMLYLTIPSLITSFSQIYFDEIDNKNTKMFKRVKAVKDLT